MTKDDIKNYLIQKGIKNSDKIANEIFCQFGQTINKDILKKVAFVIEAAEIKLEQRIIKESLSSVYDIEIINNTISPWVKEVRLNLFGFKTPPFSTEQQASEWLKNEPSSGPSSRKQMREFVNDIKNTAKELTKEQLLNSMKENFNIMKKIELTIYDKLISESSNISKLTGFSPRDIAIYVLTDIKPKFVRYNFSVNTINEYIPEIHKSINRNEFNLCINVNDLTFDEIKAIYDKYRGILNVKRKKRFSDKHEKILNLINGLGEPPDEKGRSQYFQNALLEWNKRYPDDVCNNWRNLYKTYNLIKEKLSKDINKGN